METNPYQSPQTPPEPPKPMPGMGRSVRSIAIEAFAELVTACWFWFSLHSLVLALIFLAVGIYSARQLYNKIWFAKAGQLPAEGPGETLRD
jgi:hypothetical protein